MKLKDRYLVVVGIISGKNFPIREGYNIIAEAKFDGEVLSTDPAKHAESPLFEQELAWELDKKALHQHKLQRSSLKIQFFAINNLSPIKEFLGYIMMDLRSASSEKVYKFYHLLHGKYNKHRPEICCCIYLDGDGQEVVPEDSKNGTTIEFANLKPKLITSSSNDPSYYQIGPDKLCKDGFVMSVIINEAFNLTHLIPTDIPISSIGDNSFYFFYDLFGNNVLSEKFTDLVNSKFLSERATVNILSTLDIIKMYFKHINCLQIHLCCNQHSLGIAEVPIATLLNNVDHSFQQPALLEGNFTFYNMKSSGKPMRPSTVESDEPSIKITIALQRVDRFNKEFTCKEVKIVPEIKAKPSLEYTTKKSTTLDTRSVNHKVSMNVESDFFNDNDEDEIRHHLCYTIELRSVRNLSKSDHTKRIYTRYIYPLFGSAAPIMTHPPVEIRRDQDVLLPQGYCAFEFGGVWHTLERKLFSNPLIVEIFERDKNKDSDNLLGIVKIPLNKVLSNYNKKSDHKGHGCLTYSNIGNILPVNVDKSEVNENQVIGQLVYNLTLEDFGPMKQQLQSSKKEKKTRTYSGNNAVDCENGRKTMEYKAALELEMWKEAEETSFMAQLKEKENQTMMSLTEEWKRRDKEREILVKKKITEFDELEKALRTTIINLAQRERQLAAGELELQRLRKDLEAEVERRTSDLKGASRRLEQDCQHQNLMLSSHVEHWKTMSQDWQQKYQHIDREFTLYKTRQSNTPETKLQSDINQLQADKMKLEEALESSVRSKAHYKKQWARALSEVARLKQKQDHISKDQIRRQEEELEEMKLRYKTIEESNSAAPGYLESLRKELDKLRDEAQEVKSNSHDQERFEVDTYGMDAATTEHITRLIEERDILLRTGMYTSHDQVITELDREIRKLMESASIKN